MATFVGISLFSTDGSHGSSRNKVYNNTIVQAINGRWCLNIPKSKGGGGSPVGNVVKNNIFYTDRADKGAIAVYSTAAGVLTSDYNAVSLARRTEKILPRNPKTGKHPAMASEHPPVRLTSPRAPA